MRYIYTDEAGTSAREPVTVIVGVHVKPDKGWRLANEALLEVFETIPSAFRQGFIFHATDVWSHQKYREGWSRQDRKVFLCKMMGLPRKLGMPLTLTILRRDSPVPEQFSGDAKAKFQHAIAFFDFIAEINRHICQFSADDELATIVAEDVPGMRKAFKALLNSLRSDPFTVGSEFLEPSFEQSERGETPNPVIHEATRVVDIIHFVEKDEAPLLQIADACAFGFRRYFANLSEEEDFLISILGGLLRKQGWDGPSTDATFSWGLARDFANS